MFLKRLTGHPNIVTLVDVVTSKGSDHIESALSQISLRNERKNVAAIDVASNGASVKLASLKENKSAGDDNHTIENLSAANVKTTDFVRDMAYSLSRSGNIYLVFEYIEVCSVCKLFILCLGFMLLSLLIIIARFSRVIRLKSA
jgi:hypothetical protein